MPDSTTSAIKDIIKAINKFASITVNILLIPQLSFKVILDKILDILIAFLEYPLASSSLCNFANSRYCKHLISAYVILLVPYSFC